VAEKACEAAGHSSGTWDAGAPAAAWPVAGARDSAGAAAACGGVACHAVGCTGAADAGSAAAAAFCGGGRASTTAAGPATVPAAAKLVPPMPNVNSRGAGASGVDSAGAAALGETSCASLPLPNSCTRPKCGQPPGSGTPC